MVAEVVVLLLEAPPPLCVGDVTCVATDDPDVVLCAGEPARMAMWLVEGDAPAAAAAATTADRLAEAAPTDATELL